jgi:hypothetical protein
VLQVTKKIELKTQLVHEEIKKINFIRSQIGRTKIVEGSKSNLNFDHRELSGQSGYVKVVKWAFSV